jgi:hypothetical protein
VGADSLFPFRATSRQHPLGTCIGGSTALDYALTKVSGRTSLAHRIIRRLTTPRGGLFYAPSYGYDLAELIGSTVPVSVVEQRVLEQVLYEEEVSDARTVATLANDTLTVDISVVDDDGPFELVLTSTELTVSAMLNGSTFFEEEVT